MSPEENLGIGFFTGIISMAFFHGILLASIFLCHKRFNTKSNKFLAISIFGICVILAYEFIFWLDIEAQIPIWILYLPIYIRTAIPFGIFCFVAFLIKPTYELSNFEKIGFLAMGIEILLALSYIPVNLFMKDPQSIELAEYYILLLGWLLSVIASVIFLPKALLKVNRYQKMLYNNYSTTNKKSLKWLQLFLIGTLVISIFWVISFTQFMFGFYEESDYTFMIVTICFVILLFSIGYFLILQNNWFEIAPLNEEKAEPLKNKLSANTINYYKQLKQLLDEEKLYEDVNLTLDNLSERLQISSGYLSQIIKEHEQKNFFEFINYYRIESVKTKLLDETYKHYTILGIALESGFNSKSTFNAVFKKFTNKTPSAFKRHHKAA